MDLGLLEEFRFDWELAGKAARTVDDYIAALRLLFAGSPEPDLGAAKAWMASTSYASVRRKRAQAIRAFGRWGEGTGEVVFPWWKEVPLVGEVQRPQPTATEADYRAARRKASTVRDSAIIELLWSCGLRRGELVRLDVEDVNLSDFDEIQHLFDHPAGREDLSVVGYTLARPHQRGHRIAQRLNVGAVVMGAGQDERAFH